MAEPSPTERVMRIPRHAEPAAHIARTAGTDPAFAPDVRYTGGSSARDPPALPRAPFSCRVIRVAAKRSDEGWARRG